MEKVIIDVFAGLGGEDAKDFRDMLLKMYFKFSQRKKWKVSYVDYNTLEIEGGNVYQILKGESGVHRLVRISPFDAKKLRHTSFALVEVYPYIPEPKLNNISIPEEDLKWEFARASGPGGQNVNRRETAVRVIHLPTSLAVSCRSERSQFSNREKALKLLKIKLYKLMEERKEEKLENLRVRVTPDWGHQIRSYIFHPYKMIKDHRTGKKYHIDPEKVLEEGRLDEIIEK